MNPQLLFAPWVIMAVYFLIPIVGQLCIVREKYLKLKYKFIWIIKRSKRRERRELYDIALKTKALLRVEDVIPPVILAGSLLHLFWKAVRHRGK